MIAYVRQTLPRRRAARERDRRPAQALELDQVVRDLRRIVEPVPRCLIEERTELDLEQRRREVNAVFCAAVRPELPPSVVRELWALRARLISELRGSTGPDPRSSPEFPT